MKVWSLLHISLKKPAIWLVFFCTILALAGTVSAQQPLGVMDIDRDAYVKLFLKDSSEFYVLVLAKPVPDRIIVETRNGRLEIPLEDIANVIDYRYNFVKRDELRQVALKNRADDAQHDVQQYLSRPKLPDVSTIRTKDFDVFRGHRYLFNDTAHVILSTSYGNLFFSYPMLDAIENYSGENDRLEDFRSAAYATVVDPRASQGFIMPNARAIGGGKVFASDYLLAGLQLSGGITDWLSVNGGGVFAPFLPTPIATGTLGLKVTPFQSELFGVSAGFQGIYSDVLKITKIGFPYAVATYGTWESEISVLGGISFKHEQVDTVRLGYYNSANSIIGISADARVGENLKAMVELYFISDFDIVPTVVTIRYFQSNLTIDAGVVFSLYKAGGAKALKSLGEYVFNSQFSVIPLVSASYHF